MPRELTLAQRSTAAMGAAMVSSVIITPLDVAKTLQQVSKQPVSLRGAFSRIIKREGVRKLWRGTGLMMVTAVPTVGVYLVAYDHVLARMQQNSFCVPSSVAPLCAGVTARTVAVMLSAPLELRRTRVQAPRATLATDRGAERTMQTRVLGSLSLNTIASAWRGWGTLLARDCPFSALYWMALEHARPKFMHYLASADATDGSAGNMLDYSGLVLANLASGVFAGSCAAVATTPMDVVYVNLAVRNQAGAKHTTNSTMTRQNADGITVSRTTLAVLRDVARENGVQGLFKGVVPRVARVAPACAIVVSTYELLKAFLNRREIL